MGGMLAMCFCVREAAFVLRHHLNEPSEINLALASTSHANPSGLNKQRSGNSAADHVDFGCDDSEYTDRYWVATGKNVDCITLYGSLCEDSRLL